MPRIRLRKRGLPKRFDRLKGASKALAIADIRVSKGARIRMKLLVFKNRRDLLYFWKHGLGKGDLGRYCCGAVQSLGIHHTVFRKDGSEESWTDVDPCYFAVMGLVQSELNMEIITHESVHAGYAYAARSNSKWPNQAHNDEDALCYPVGRIASMVNRFLHDNKLYKK